MWKPIPNYEGHYEASDSGKIRTVHNKITTNKKYSQRVWKQRELKFNARKRHNNSEIVDYMVTLWKDNKPHKYLVSRLIATTFCGNFIDTELTVNHIDGNPENNSVKNLEWVTRANNIKYGFENGQYSKCCKNVEIMSESGIVMKFASMSKTDSFLNRYSGYTHSTIKNGKSTLISKNGEKYFIKGVNNHG